MQRQARRDTNPEMALRAELHRRGYRYRVDIGVLKGSRRRQDVVFAGARVVVDIRGCFWHGCPEHGTVPKANRAWWISKVQANRERDADTEARLALAGWHTVVVWEHEDATI